jgi:serine/threonine protein kinase
MNAQLKFARNDFAGFTRIDHCRTNIKRILCYAQSKFMATYDGWETVEPPLGEGGQGTVHKARRPQRTEFIHQSSVRLADALRQINENPRIAYAGLAQLIVEIGSPDKTEDLGALKVFKIQGPSPARDKALGRLSMEVKALESIDYPAVLRLLHHNKDKNFIVTEYHPLGTLDAQLDKYRGRALEALLAFKPLVEGVGLIHRQGAIHRDIKTENISSLLTAD